MDRSNILQQAVYRILKPLIKMLLRNQVAYGAFEEIAKTAFVQAAGEFRIAGKKQTDSRIATLTGLTRKDVHRLKQLMQSREPVQVARYNRAIRVVYGWVHDPRYSPNGEALVLPFEGEPSVSGLVRTYSGDIPPRTILNELLRAGVVEESGDEGFKLVNRAFIPRRDIIESYRLLGQDVAGLIKTMDGNIHGINRPPLFQRKVFYDNLPDHAVADAQSLLFEKGQAFLEEFDRWLAQRDKDVNTTIKAPGKKTAGIGIYFFEENQQEDAT